MRKLFQLSLFICLIVLFVSNTTQGVSAKLGVYGRLNIWTVAETKKVLRSDAAESSKSVSIFAAKNEWESFQILLRSSNKPVSNVKLIAANLVDLKGNIISTDNAKLYRADQIYISRRSTKLENNPFFTPDWYPDALIPFDAPTANAKLRAIPFNLPKNETHGFFIDLYVPKNTKPGIYKGIYKVTAHASNEVVAEIPVSLEVWDFALPDITTLSTDFGSTFQRFKNQYPRVSGKAKSEIDFNAASIQIMNLLVEHRINPQEIPTNKGLIPKEKSDGTYFFTKDQAEEVRNLIDTYMINSIRIGRIGSPIKLIKDNAFKSKTLTREELEKLKNVLKAFDDLKLSVDRNVEFYSYLIDEPKTLFDYDFTRNLGREIVNQKSVVKVLVTEQIRPEKDFGNLYGAVDIWTPLFKEFDYKDVMARQAKGNTVWSYTTLARWQIDSALINYRIPTWISWYYGVKGLLYWSVDYWNAVDDPWTEPYTWCNANRIKCADKLTGPSLYNGEGVLVYPAHKVGFDGIVPSIRLKAIRDAIEDYEYLVILEKHGKKEEARELIRKIFNNSSSTDSGNLIKNFYLHNYTCPIKLHMTRKNLAEMILALPID